MSLESELQVLVNNKAAIKAAIEARNPSVAPTEVMSNWPASIASISGGGGFMGFTLSFSNQFALRNGQIGQASVTLVHADGSTTLLTLSTQLQGTSYSDVVMVECGLWTRASSYGFNQIALKDMGWVDVSTQNFGRGVGFMSGGKKYTATAVIEATELESYYPGMATYNLNAWDKGVFTPASTFVLPGDSEAVYYAGWVACLLAGTMIRMADGSDKPIESVSYSDRLLAWDFDTGRFTEAKPLWIKRGSPSSFWFKNTMSDGRVLRTAGMDRKDTGHRVFDIDRGEFAYTTESVSDRVYSLDGELTHRSCERVDAPCTVYNVITDYHMNLFADGILTSCSYNNIYPVKDMKFMKEKRVLRPFEAYDVPLRYYSGLRLSEQTMSVSEVNDYVCNLVKLEV